MVRRAGDLLDWSELPPKKDEIWEKNEVPDIGCVGRCCCRSAVGLKAPGEDGMAMEENKGSAFDARTMVIQVMRKCRK